MFIDIKMEVVSEKKRKINGEVCEKASPPKKRSKRIRELNAETDGNSAQPEHDDPNNEYRYDSSDEEVMFKKSKFKTSEHTNLCVILYQVN